MFIYHYLFTLVLKSSYGEWPITYTFTSLLLLLVPYNKQLNNLDRSVVMGKSQTSAYHIDVAIARSTQQGLSLRFSRNDLTLGY